MYFGIGWTKKMAGIASQHRRTGLSLSHIKVDGILTIESVLKNYSATLKTRHDIEASSGRYNSHLRYLGKP